MKWTIVWVDNSEDELAHIWMPEDPDAVREASHRIEEELKYRADKVGEDFYGDRIFQYGPLALVYEPRPEDCQARIMQVIQIKQTH